MFSSLNLRVVELIAVALRFGLLLSLGLISISAIAAPPELRATTAAGSFADTRQLAVAFDVWDPQRLGIHHLELSVGTVISEPRLTPLVSIGPVWRHRLAHAPLVLQASVSPTLIGRDEFRGQDLGGHVHFTSAVSIGWMFESGATIAIRVQHTSNAGLQRTNPGLDMIGLSFRLGRNR